MMGKAILLLLVGAVISAAVSTSLFPTLFRVYSRQLHASEVLDPSTNILALDFNYRDTKASATRTPDGLDLKIEMKGSFYNRGDEPLYLDFGYHAESFAAGDACFEAESSAFKSEVGTQGPIEIAPKQILPVTIGGIYKRTWKDATKPGTPCYDYGYIEATIQTSSFFRAISFAPIQISLNKDGEIEPVIPIASISDDHKASDPRPVPHIFVETEPFAHRHADPDLDDAIAKIVLSIDPKKKP